MGKLFTYDLTGANRGGKENASCILERTRERFSFPPFSVRVIDPNGERAKALAKVFSQNRVPATFKASRAEEIGSEADIRTLAIDDPLATFRLVEVAPRNNKLFQAGLLLAFPQFTHTGLNLGGNIVAVGTTITEGQDEVKGQARALFGLIASLSGGRRSSSQMRASIINSFQMRKTRRLLHEELSEDAVGFMAGEGVNSRLFIVDGLSGEVFPTVVLETSRKTSREGLKKTLIGDIARLTAHKRLCGVFCDDLDPWLYIVFAKNSGKNWFVAKTLEMPQISFPPLRLEEVISEIRETRREIEEDIRRLQIEREREEAEDEEDNQAIGIGGFEPSTSSDGVGVALIALAGLALLVTD